MIGRWQGLSPDEIRAEEHLRAAKTAEHEATITKLTARINALRRELHHERAALKRLTEHQP